MSAENFNREGQVGLTETNYQKQMVTGFKASVGYSSSTYLCVTPD